MNWLTTNRTVQLTEQSVFLGSVDCDGNGGHTVLAECQCTRTQQEERNRKTDSLRQNLEDWSYRRAVERYVEFKLASQLSKTMTSKLSQPPPARVCTCVQFLLVKKDVAAINHQNCTQPIIMWSQCVLSHAQPTFVSHKIKDTHASSCFTESGTFSHRQVEL